MPAPRSYPAKPAQVYFFATCLVDTVYPEAGLAAIRLLQREGLEVIFPQAQSCCGQPAYNAGFPREARAVARRQLRAFPRDLPIVVPSGSCGGMLRHHYPYLFAGRPEWEAAQRFAARVFEWGEFMRHVLQVRLEDRGPPLRVAWHSSCHALREMRIVEDSKALVRQLARVELVELAREEECCGFGGTFAVKQPAISAAMVGDKVTDIQGTGAGRLVTGDCGCLLNIGGALAHRGLAVQGQHLAEFIWERTHG